VALVVAFLIGITVFRGTHAIWGMTSQNAVTMNSTMNLVFGRNLVVEVIVLGVVILVAMLILSRCGSMGFGGD
jgi:uncharacterized Tic20 family protein